MTTYTTFTDSGPSGGTIYFGQNAPAGGATPAWAIGAPLNAWIPVPGTTGTGGAAMQEYSSYVKVGTKAYCSLCGGHGTADNRTTMIDLGADNPGTVGWVLKDPPSASSNWLQNVGRYADGKPSSRHVRFLAYYVPSMGIVHPSTRDMYGGGGGTDGELIRYDLTTNTWDPLNTWPRAGASGNGGGGFMDPDGNLWVQDYNNSHKYTLSTNTWNDNPLTVKVANGVRYPWATAPNYVFGLCYGDGWGYGNTLNAVKQSGAGYTVQQQITFNSSAAVTQFMTDGTTTTGGAFCSVMEAGMCYVPDGGYFLYHSGQIQGRFYKIIPNAGTVWDMELFSFSSTAVMPERIDAGAQNRLQYWPEFKGIIYKPLDTSTFYYMRTA